MTTSCAKCACEFNVTIQDALFLDRFSIPHPTLCPCCRQQRRAAFRNSRNLYRRLCDKSGAQIVSLYSPDKPFKVYATDIWWGDSWDPIAYGRPINFDEPFFPQFQRLMREVPRPALFNKGSENSIYTNHAVYNKNCYMCFNAGYCEDTFYSGDVAVKCKDCCDLVNVIEGQLLYDCTDCTKCYDSAYLTRCSECSGSRFLFDCRGCNNCIACWNLRNKSHCILNEQLTPSEYSKRLASMNFGSRAFVDNLQREFLLNVKSSAAHQAVVSESVENAIGDYIFQSKNIIDSFDVHNSEDIKYCYDVWDIKDCMDVYQTMDKAELQYETHASSVSREAFFCNISHENYNIQYTDHCFNSRDLFGCIGLRQRNNCIFNTQYSENEFKALKNRLIEHMKNTGEYGEFFPATLSPFGYNETVANDYFPLSSSDSACKVINEPQFNWSTYETPAANSNRSIDPSEVPDSITEVTADLLDQPISCAVTAKPFKIVKHELALYKKIGLPVPVVHPNIRFSKRMSARNPRVLRATRCVRCLEDIQTSIPVGGPANIHCKECYQAVIYT